MTTKPKAANTKHTESEVQAQLEIIVTEVNSKKGYGAYAIAYAKLAQTQKGHELKCQIPYILNNLQEWQGEHAHHAKEVLNAFVKQE